MHTFTAIYLHVVFATWNRQPFLRSEIRARVHAYFAGAARNMGLEDVTVGGVEDHLHFLARFDPAVAPSAVVGRLKQSATTFLHDTDSRLARFRWQRGFSAFSVSQDRLPAVRRYIENQQAHHHRRSFQMELEELLREFGVRDAGLL